ncbi:SusC/RagA family TonB-linked outer membrane protein [Reichenbachiella versicolor]|uniref:SusC/RagA family TonB-linked outer membrane protein n=1 Tax=Reichenbachiella versicolor TaxID=1821036 RepID=UPI000D6E6B8C|nr:TonB-dependent receptor [Reichenbachiella versicolor]
MREKTKLLRDFSRWGACCMILFLLASMLPQSAIAQQVTVSGKISDENGDPLPGVNVLIKGAATGTITDIDGEFTLSLNEGAVLSFSFIGYKTQEVSTAGRSRIEVGMVLDVESLEEVVVVGFSEQKKASVVGAIVTTKGENIVQSGGVTTVSEALTGLLPGVTTQQNAGIPGASQADILIRGKASWGDSAPLILVDGVERDMNNIDPNEIASVTVLKDASATAVYGSRAANGAIIVTTKSGKKGEVKVSFTANFGVKLPTTDFDFLTPFPENLRAKNIGLINDKRYAELVAESRIAEWEDPNRNPDTHSYTDWPRKLLGPGYNQSYNLNISGGNDFVTYFTSLGHNNDGDLFQLEKQPDYDPRTTQKRFNFRQNVDFKLTKTTKLGVKLAGEVTNWNGNPMTATGDGLGFSPGGNQDPNYNLELNQFYSWPQVGPQPQFSTGEFSREENSQTNANYLVKLQESGSVQKRSNRLWTDFTLNQDLKNLVPGLKLRAKFAVNNYVQYEQKMQLTTLQYSSAPEDRTFDEDGNLVGLGLRIEGADAQSVQNRPKLQNETIKKYNKRLYYEGGFDYNNTFGKHTVTGMALFYRQESVNGADNLWPDRIESYVGRATYDFDTRYFAEINGAYQGTNKFGPDYRWGLFPSAAVGWILTNESFMEGTKSWLDHLKFRYSYGISGNDRNANRFGYRTTFTEDTNNNRGVYFGPNKQNIGKLNEARIANEKAGWEESTKQNLGIEFGFFKSQLTLNVDMFNESRTDIPFELEDRISVFAGYPEKPETTTGETKNQGVEFDLGWRDVINADWSYWVKGNFSITENRILLEDDPLGAPDYQKQAGHPIGTQFAIIQDGLYQSWDDVYNNPRSGFDMQNIIPGDMRYIDFNGDGIVSALDRVAIGNSRFATKSYAFSGGVQYKGISLTARFNGVFGMDKLLSRSYLWEWESRSQEGFLYTYSDMQDHWTPENPGAKHPSLHATRHVHSNETSSYYIRKADYLKLQMVEVAYQVPMNSVKAISSLQLYVNGNNLWTWTSLPDAFDPESRRVEVYPIARRFNVGFRLNL